MAKRKRSKRGISRRNSIGPVGQVQRQLIDPRPVREQRFWQIPLIRGENPNRKDGRVFVRVVRRRGDKPLNPLVVMEQRKLEQKPLRPAVPGSRRSRDRLLAVGMTAHRQIRGARTVLAAQRLAARRNEALRAWRDKVCAERAKRREVMHATGKAGGKVSKPRPPSQLSMAERMEREVKCPD